LTALAATPQEGVAPARPEPGREESADAFRPDPAWKPLGPSLWFDPKGRTLVLRARVVLREGPLEHLLCLKGTKEHEAILATPLAPPAPPRRTPARLPPPAAEPAPPAPSPPKSDPPAGTPIAIELVWDEGGNPRRADARSWVLDERKKTPLATDWVFAGSGIV